MQFLNYINEWFFKTVDSLEERAKRASIDDMFAIMNKVPDVEPESRDKI